MRYLFDEKELYSLILDWESLTGDTMPADIYNYVNSEIVRNVRESLERVKQSPYAKKLCVGENMYTGYNKCVEHVTDIIKEELSRLEDKT